MNYKKKITLNFTNIINLLISSDYKTFYQNNIITENNYKYLYIRMSKILSAKENNGTIRG